MITGLELRRQAFHMAYGTILVVLLMQGIIAWQHLAALSIAGIALSWYSKSRRVRFISRMLNLFEREDAKKMMPGRGMLFFTIGAMLAVLLYPRELAMAALMILAFADSTSHLFGRSFGKIRHPFNKLKLIEGTILGAVVGTVAAMLFVPWQHAALASAAAMIVEGIDIRWKDQTVDDNLTIPLVAGAVLLALQTI